MPRFTDFPNGITSLGIPTFGTGMLPPFTGKYWFVEENPSIIGQNGGLGSASQPFNTIQQALAAATPANNDVIFLTGTVHVSASQGSILWTGSETHLVGLSAPLRRGKRARISVTGATGFNNLFNVTGSGCYFLNFQTFFGFPATSGALVNWLDAGGRNMYDGVEFLGFGDTTTTTGTANLTGARALLINNSVGESTFRRCVFGADTTTRNATNYTVEVAGHAPRITFEDCDFESYLGSSGGASSHLLIGSGGIDRYLNLNGCRFLNAVGAGATAMAQAFNVSASAGGRVEMNQCRADGITAWETAPSGSVYTDMSAVGAAGVGGISLVL
jgi:hypothetical protein